MAPVGSATDVVRYKVSDGVAVLTLDAPPLNALGQPLRAGLLAAFERAESDVQVGAIVIAAAGRSWPVGADIREFGQPPLAPGLPDILNRIAACAKPVIAALHGTALGGGLELALVAACRIALSSIRCGLPEITLGILPGAGGTQRLPRLVGADAALDLMLTGTPVGAEHALAVGLIDLVVSEDPLEAALRRARDHVAGHRPLPTARDRAQREGQDPGRYMAAIEDARGYPRAAHDRAARLIVDCVEAALLLPPAQGFAKERAAFEDLVASPQARALRHAFIAERRAARALEHPGDLPGLSHVAIAGGGDIGSGLATALLRRGLNVTLVETSPETLGHALTRIARAEEAAVVLGERSEAEREAAWSRLNARHGDPCGPLTFADLVIDATVEDLDARVRILGRLAEAAGPDTPILSVTNALDPQILADATGDPSLHASLYLREPVRRVGLAEIALPAEAGPAATGAALALGRLLGWRFIRPGPIAGFIGPRLLAAYLDAADRCFAGGATPDAVDQAMTAFGLPVGPYALEDAIGIRARERSTPVRRAGVSEAPLAAALRDWLLAEDRTGGGGVRGWHLRHPDDAPGPDPLVEAEAAALRPARLIAPAEIQRRILAAMANEGCWLLSEGRARAPWEVDLAALARGWPRWRGGPMQAADEAGLLLLRDDLRRWAEATGDRFWDPAPLWSDLIREGRSFADLNGTG